jgi:hypothetical protein
MTVTASGGGGNERGEKRKKGGGGRVVAPFHLKVSIKMTLKSPARACCNVSNFEDKFRRHVGDWPGGRVLGGKKKKGGKKEKRRGELRWGLHRLLGGGEVRCKVSNFEDKFRRHVGDWLGGWFLL